uniref:Src kinase-associated phosphoprotein 2 n=1 Tax=Nothobranchius kuhntae TaxID=321403 RepID=A0A1A8HLY4_NOTKU
MRPIPEELTSLISDLEHFISDGLKGETLSKKAKEKRESFIKRIKEVKLSFPQEFEDKGGDDSEDEDDADSNNDGASLQSERTDKDEEAYEGAQQSPPVAAQDLTCVIKGFLEKRRKDHSFFGTEWQKRWCALSHHTFYYYGSEKDKQQKGEFSIDGYTVKINNTLRKDAKKDCCFEISAPDKRVYQFCASSVKDAEEWVRQIDFVLKDMSGIIPEEDEEQFMYDDVGNVGSFAEPDEIYEELPEEEGPAPAKPPPKVDPVSKPAAAAAAVAVDRSTDYPNYYQGLWDCVGDRPDELTFKRGEVIYILSKEYNTFGWWVGEKNGSVGIVPREYLMELYAV